MKRGFDETRRQRLRNPLNILLLVIVLSFSLWETLATWGPRWFHMWVTLSEYVHAFEDWMPWYSGKAIVFVLCQILCLHLIRLAFV